MTKDIDRRRRIRERREALGLTLDELGKMVGVSGAAVGQWEDEGPNGTIPRTTKWAAIAKALRKSEQWIQFGENQLAMPLPDYNVEAGPQARGMVPLISWIKAGHWFEVADPYAMGDAEEWLPCPRKAGPRTFALRVRGISMEPRYHDGEIIFVDPDAPAINGSRVVVRLDADKEATFKQLVIEGDRKFLKALNPAWPDPLIPVTEEATICGVVIGKWVPE